MKNWITILLSLTFAISGILLLQNNLQIVSIDSSNEVTADHITTKAESSNIKEQSGIPLVQDSSRQNKISKEIEYHLSHEALQKAVGEYFDNYSTLSEDTRSAQANELNYEINDLENRDEIIPIEALSLKLALLKTTTPDSEYPDLAKKLTERYEERIGAERPEIDYDKNAAYKERERVVLQEIQAMSQYPDGMSQSEYLRHRLQLLRAEVFEDSE